jgi:hypothetical protein
LVQALGHEAEEPLQTYGPQEGVPALPATIGLHVPTIPVRLHASKAPLHAVLQHTPSTQLPLTHSLAAEQVAALGFLGTHAPPAQ